MGEHGIVNWGAIGSAVPFVRKPILPSVLLRRVHSLLCDGRALVE